MVLYKGIKAFVAPSPGNHEPFSEHQTPMANEIYIEAVTGKSFKVVVEITPEFEIKGSPDVKVTYLIDDCHTLAHTFSATEIKAACESSNERRATFDTSCRIINGKWMECGLTFADLKIGKLIHGTF